jgi:hypothetical protein
MRGYFGLGQLSAADKQDILNQHKSLYNGYQTMQPQVSNTQPLYTYDDISDKNGFVVNNKGEVKKYTNMGINEQVETNEVCDECGAMIMDGMCTECNYGHMEEVYTEGSKMCEQCGGVMKEDVCEQCNMEEETGHLDDIYDEEDLNPSAGFDYVTGSSNDEDTFEGMHKNLYKEQDDDDFEDYESSYTEDGVDDPDNEDDGFEDMNASEVTDGELDELGIADLVKGKKYRYKHPLYDPQDIEFDSEHKYDGGNPMYSFKQGDTGHLMGSKTIEDYLEDIEDDEVVYELELDEYDADDMDVSDVEPAYNFDSKGPGDVYPVNELDEDDMYAYEPEKMYEFDKMESAWSEEELEEQPDISGVQGIYGAMDRAYDFDSDGPGKGGPYQEFSYESELEENEEFTSTKDNFEEVDEDLKESFIGQRNRIIEMFNRFGKYN